MRKIASSLAAILTIGGILWWSVIPLPGRGQPRGGRKPSNVKDSLDFRAEMKKLNLNCPESIITVFAQAVDDHHEERFAVATQGYFQVKQGMISSGLISPDQHITCLENNINLAQQERRE